MFDVFNSDPIVVDNICGLICVEDMQICIAF